jgi:hypothetical protein
MGSDRWHYHAACRGWPAQNFELAERPRCGIVCPECKGRRPSWRA